MSETFPEAYDRELERNEELLREYRQLPAESGWFAVSVLTDLVERARKARRELDTVEMLACYAQLQQSE